MNFHQLKDEVLKILLDPLTLAFIQSKVDQAPIYEVPYPHLIIENLFPEDLYKHLQNQWPKHSHFKQKNNDRQFLWINYGCLSHSSLSSYQKIFWQVFGEILFNRMIKPRLIKKFMPHLPKKFIEYSYGELLQIEKDLEFWNNRQDALIQYPAQRSLDPHLDESNIFIQILSYFPTDTSHQNLGTSLYEGPPTPTLKVKEILRSDLKLCKTVPYQPGQFLAFLNSPISWHGVDGSLDKNLNYMRRVYMGSVSLSPESVDRIYKGSVPYSAYDLYSHELLLQEISS